MGDSAVIPPGEERHYVERIHRVPGTYLAFEVLYPVPEVAPPPSLSAGAGRITFGCLGSQYKLTDAVLAALESAGVLVRPGSAALRYTQDKLAMRERLSALGVPCPRFAPISSVADVERFAGGSWPVVAPLS